MFAKPHELKQIVLQINNIYILWQYVGYVLSLDLPLNIYNNIKQLETAIHDTKNKCNILK